MKYSERSIWNRARRKARVVTYDELVTVTTAITEYNEREFEELDERLDNAQSAISDIGQDNNALLNDVDNLSTRVADLEYEDD